MRRVSAVLALLCLFIAGCDADFKSDTREGDGVVSISSTKLDSFIKVRVAPSEEPEKYFVYFGWPRIEDKKRVRIRTDRQLALVEPDQVSFTHKTDHNQTLTYFFEILDEASRVERSFSKLVTIPRDWVVREGANSLGSSQKILVERLFISNVPIQTNGFELELITSELHSEDGLIQTFPENAKAKGDTNGRAGGKIVIRAKQATGSLTIAMRGEDGGDGSKGPAWGTRAASGSPSGRGREQCSSARGEGERTCWCTQDGPGGGAGAPGAQGHPGFPAGNGGATGALTLEIVDGREFSLRTLKYAGKPGTPGEGGDGQLGGVGVKSEETCSGPAGPTGPQGAKGPSGKFGVNGAEDPSCIYIASEARNECL